MKEAIRHAALITAYKDFESLFALLDKLSHSEVLSFVHIDKKIKCTPEQISLIKKKSIFFTQRFKVYWGSYSHLEAICYLSAIALKTPEIGFIHFLSGQDYLVGDLNLFDTEKIYMLAEPIASTIPVVQERFRFRKIAYHIEQCRSVFNPIDRAFLKMQKLLGAKRSSSRHFPAIYKGLIWLSIPSSTLKHVFESQRARLFLKEIRSYYLPEEFFFQTVLMNSKFRSSIVYDNLRYADWRRRNGHQPAILDVSDLDSVRQSGAVFARKFDSVISRDLMEIIRYD